MGAVLLLVVSSSHGAPEPGPCDAAVERERAAGATLLRAWDRQRADLERRAAEAERVAADANRVAEEAERKAAAASARAADAERSAVAAGRTHQQRCEGTFSNRVRELEAAWMPPWVHKRAAAAWKRAGEEVGRAAALAPPWLAEEADRFATKTRKFWDALVAMRERSRRPKGAGAAATGSDVGARLAGLRERMTVERQSKRFYAMVDDAKRLLGWLTDQLFAPRWPAIEERLPAQAREFLSDPSWYVKTSIVSFHGWRRLAARDPVQAAMVLTPVANVAQHLRPYLPASARESEAALACAAVATLALAALPLAKITHMYVFPPLPPHLRDDPSSSARSPAPSPSGSRDKVRRRKRRPASSASSVNTAAAPADVADDASSKGGPAAGAS